MTPATARGSAFCAVALALALALAAGCGDDDGPTEPGDQAPADTFGRPATPGGAAGRMFEIYRGQDLYWFERMLTQDFRYTFSSETDADLVAAYGDDWGRAEEIAAAENVFEGVGPLGMVKPAANSISWLPFGGLVLGVDGEHADSSFHYFRIRVSDSRHTFNFSDASVVHAQGEFQVYVVRGDIAVLGPDQPADSTIYYVRKIVDQSEVLGSEHPAFGSVTWGSIRGEYADAFSRSR